MERLEIKLLEEKIQELIDENKSPIFSIPDISNKIPGSNLIFDGLGFMVRKGRLSSFQTGKMIKYTANPYYFNNIKADELLDTIFDKFKDIR